MSSNGSGPSNGASPPRSHPDLDRATSDALSGLAWDSDDAVLLARLDDQMVIDVNPAFEQLTGIRAEDAAGRHVGELEVLTGIGDLGTLLAVEGSVHDHPVVLHAPGGEVLLGHLAATTRRVGLDVLVVMIVRDVTEQLRTEQLLAAEHDIARALAGAGSADKGALALARLVCERLGWDLAGWWVVDEPAGVLRFGGVAWRPGDAPPGTFEALASTMTCRPGEQMLGQAWTAGRAIWTVHPSPYCFDGMTAHTGVAVPVRDGERTIGMFDFCRARHTPVEPALLEALDALASQFALFLAAHPSE